MKALFGTLTKCGYVQSIIAGKLFATEVITYHLNPDSRGGLESSNSGTEDWVRARRIFLVSSR